MPKNHPAIRAALRDGLIRPDQAVELERRLEQHKALGGTAPAATSVGRAMGMVIAALGGATILSLLAWALVAIWRAIVGG